MSRVCGALPIGLLLFAASAGLERVQAAPLSCALSLTATADDSFAQAGREATPERLSRLAALTRDRFAAAAYRLCAAGVLKPADVAGIRRLIVQNGEGATEPILYRQSSMGLGIFVFQFAFQDGGPPEPTAFEQALRCWKRPRSSGCEAGD